MSEFPVYDFNPYALPPALLQAIGLSVTSFAQTEDILRNAIAGCAGLDFEYGAAMTTHMPLPLCFNTLQACAEIRLDVDALNALDIIIEDIKKASELRNNIAHNRWAMLDGSLAGYLKTQARSSLTMELIPSTIAQVESDARFIYEAGLKFNLFLNKHRLHPSIPPDPRPRSHKTKAARKKARK